MNHYLEICLIVKDSTNRKMYCSKKKVLKIGLKSLRHDAKGKIIRPTIPEERG